MASSVEEPRVARAALKNTDSGLSSGTTSSVRRQVRVSSTASVQLLPEGETPVASGSGTLESDLRQLQRTVAAASLSTFCLGYNTGIVAGAQAGLQQDPAFGVLNTSLADGELVSCALLGAAVGAVCGQFANLVGRRRMLLAVAVVFLISPIAMALSPDFVSLLAARTMSGMSIGVSSVLVNLYITEVSPAACRGRLGGWAPFIGTTGILVSYVVSSLLGPLTYGAWRWQFGLASVPALCILILQGSIPETPRWLLSQSRRGEAKESMARLFPKASEESLEAELQRIEADLSHSMQLNSVSTIGLFKTHRMPTFIGMSINILQQVSGINVFIYFAPEILAEAGFGKKSMVMTTLISLVQLTATAVLIRYIDKVGRRPLALGGLLGMLAGLAFLVVADLLRGSGANRSLTAVGSLLGMLIFRASFSLSLGPLPYIMTSEFFPQEARAAGVGLCWGTNWASNFIVSLTFPIMNKALPGDRGQAAIFGIYGFFTIVAYVFVRQMLPETNGLRLEAAGAQTETAPSVQSPHLVERPPVESPSATCRESGSLS